MVKFCAILSKNSVSQVCWASLLKCKFNISKVPCCVRDWRLKLDGALNLEEKNKKIPLPILICRFSQRQGMGSCSVFMHTRWMSASCPAWDDREPELLSGWWIQSDIWEAREPDVSGLEEKTVKMWQQCWTLLPCCFLHFMSLLNKVAVHSLQIIKDFLCYY